MDINTNEVLAYHEAGHAVMVRLMGRCVNDIVLQLNVERTYNGGVIWERCGFARDWDPNIPYEELQLQQQQSKQSIALIFAAGKAAERLRYRQIGMDEALADFGPGGEERNDEQEMEMDLLSNFPHHKEKIAEAKNVTVDLATSLLEHEKCWRAVNAVAQAILKAIDQKQHVCMISDAQELIANVFADRA